MFGYGDAVVLVAVVAVVAVLPFYVYVVAKFAAVGSASGRLAFRRLCRRGDRGGKGE